MVCEHVRLHCDSGTSCFMLRAWTSYHRPCISSCPSLLLHTTVLRIAPRPLKLVLFPRPSGSFGEGTEQLFLGLPLHSEAVRTVDPLGGVYRHSPHLRVGPICLIIASQVAGSPYSQANTHNLYHASSVHRFLKSNG